MTRHFPWYGLFALSMTVLLSSFSPAATAQEAEHPVAIAAHRGFWKNPRTSNSENSVAALAEAQREKLWGSEFDVHLTADDVVVVNHDNDIQGISIHDNPYSMIKDLRLPNGERIPTLEDYLTQAMASPYTMLVLEVKNHGNPRRSVQLSEKCLEVLKSFGLLDPEKVMFISFSHPACRYLAEVLPPEFKVQYLEGDKDPEEVAADGINGIDYNYSVLTEHPEWVKKAHDKGMDVNVWTVNDPEVMKQMIDLGVDCITTNEPLVLREILGEKEAFREIDLPQPEEYDPVADPDAVVVSGNARFTVLTPRLIRMEWSEDGSVEDRATLGVVNRNLPVPEFSVKKTSKGLTITTSDLTLTYTGGKFDEKSLSIKMLTPDPIGKPAPKKPQYTVWHPGMSSEGNLLGTTRTLDRCDGENVIDPFDEGVVSRDGWAVLDESLRHVFVPIDSDWGNWVAERDGVDRQDLYFFGYGHDYMEAVSDFTLISGRIPMPPKYAFGYWWCRYWEYSDYELVDLAQHFKDLGIPADVMIIDMDWHETWNPEEHPGLKDESGEGLGWTGYTWKKELFPDPENLLTTLHNYGLKTSLNLHPASGIQIYEEPYERFVKDYLSRTNDYDGPKDFLKADGTPTYVPFRMDQVEWADAYFNSVMRPFEKQGVDFWWLDWQQFKESKYVPGLSNTFWLNYTFFQDKVRKSAAEGIRAERPMIYHRWGGIGSHRYQVGFSGDTYATWKVLGYLPYFTSTASNVGYGYWGHDIGGHMQPRGVDFTDPELYTRWLQSGVFTPIFKTHSTKDMTMEKRFWVFPDHFDAMRKAIRLRYDLSPYIYMLSREAYDTGISMSRPLYYYYPEREEAYSWKEEFFFGQDILATTVCAPVDKATGLAPRSIWFPEGYRWFDTATGTLHEGDTVEDLEYTIDENPYYVREGSIVVMASPEIGSLQETSSEYWIHIYPGEGDSETLLYEDDGKSQAYFTEYATTRIAKSSTEDSMSITIGGREGTFEDAPTDRTLRIVIESVLPPTEVIVNGKHIRYSRFPSEEMGSSVWTYDGENLNAVIYLSEEKVWDRTGIDLFWDGEARPAEIEGKRGLIKRMMALTPEVKYNLATKARGKAIPKVFLDIAQCGSYLTEDPAGAIDHLLEMDVDGLNTKFSSFEGLEEDFLRKVKAQTDVK
ncbi:MAG: DUF5110 domain-containing protein [Bacteroidales bacterium]|nr:DUF5110 domain-containing protein [Bacteroidales bacterium]